MIFSKGKTFSREEIGKIINISKERSVDVIITRLRQKLEHDPKTHNTYKQWEDLDMFFGLNKYIKNLLPKRLFYRSLFIIVTPVILLQVIISVVFFDSLWIKSNKELTRTIVDEVRLISDVYKNNNEKEIERVTGLYKNNLDFIITFNENAAFRFWKERKMV